MKEIIRQAVIDAANAEEAGNPEQQTAIIDAAVAKLVTEATVKTHTKEN